MRHLLGEHEVAVVVAALAAVLLGIGEAEEAELAHARGRPSRGRSSPPTPRRAGASSFVDERADRLAQLVVLLGEDEVLALGAVVGLQDVCGGGHASSVSSCAGLAGLAGWQSRQ